MKLALTLLTTASLVYFFPFNSAIAEDLVVCRPRNVSMLQRVTQKLAFPTHKLCKKGLQGKKLRLQNPIRYNFLPGTQPIYQDEQGQIYKPTPSDRVIKD